MKKKVLVLVSVAVILAASLLTSSQGEKPDIKKAYGYGVVACPQDRVSTCNIDDQTFSGYYEISVQKPKR